MSIERIVNWQYPDISPSVDDPESLRGVIEWLRIHYIEHDEESANVVLDFEKLVVDTIYPTNITSTNIITTNIMVTTLTDGYVPYHVSDAIGLADSIIFYDGTNIGIGIDADQKFEIGSADNSNRLSLYHDNTDGYFKWDDGVLWFQTDEGTNTQTQVGLKGKGNLGSIFYFYGPNDDYATWQKGNMWFAVESGQVDGDVLILNPNNNNNVEFFTALGTTTNPEIRIAGYITAGSALRYTALTMDDANDEFLIKPENNASHEGITINLTETNQRFRIRQGSNLIAMHHDKIGIETDSPEGNIDVVGATGGTLTTLGSETYATILQQRLSNDLDDGFGPTLAFWTSNDQSDTWQVGAIEATSQTGHGGALRFYTPDGGSTNPSGRRTKGSSLIERLKIDNAGDISIKTSNAELRFYEGANYVGFEAPALSANQIWVLPNADATIAGQGLKTDASGNLGWEAFGLRDLYNGTFNEAFNALVTSTGGTVTMAIEKAGGAGGDLTMQFSDGDTILDCTPALTITLTAGDDDSPTDNFIYILQSDKILTKSISGFPTSGEHIKVGYFFVPSASFVENKGVYINQNWNNMVSDPTNQGHLTHMSERSRRLGARYFSGVAGNGTSGYLTPTASTVYLKSTSGVVYQLHRHVIGAFDTSSGDQVLIANWNGDAYHDITNLFDITKDSTDVTIGNNKYFNLTVWGVANKSGEYTPMMINLPSGFYNKQSSAENDISGYDEFNMPHEFNTDSSTGFLIARITIKMGTTWTVTLTKDLRGAGPLTASGGASGPIVEFPDNTFQVFDESDVTKILVFDVGTDVLSGNTRTLTVPNANTKIWSDDGSVPLTANWNVGAFDITVQTLTATGSMHIPNMKSGINQGAASAAAGELWFDTDDDNTVKMGV